MRRQVRAAILAFGIVGVCFFILVTTGLSEEKTLEDSTWEGAREITTAQDQLKALCPKVLRIWAKVLEAEGCPEHRAAIEEVATMLDEIPIVTSNSGRTPVPLPLTPAPPLDEARWQCPRWLLAVGQHFRHEYVFHQMGALAEVDVPYKRDRRAADCIEVAKGARKIGAAILEETRRGRIESEGGPLTDPEVTKLVASYAQTLMNAANAEIGYCTTGDAELVYGQQEKIIETLKKIEAYLGSQQI